MECEEFIGQYLATLKEGFKCVRSDRRLRVVTPYVYPDNDLIEVFVEELGNNRVKVTDLGETLRHLHSQGFDVFTSPKRKFLAETVASRVGVGLSKGQLTKIGDVSKVGEILLDLIVASRGIADLIYTSKAYEPATFFDEVKNYLTEKKFSVEPRHQLEGTSKKRYRVDFRISDGQAVKPAFLQTLSPANIMGIKAKVDGTFRMWSDCDGELRKVSLLNDIDFQWKEPDVIILKRVSRVDFWSSREELVRYLRAAG